MDKKEIRQYLKNNPVEHTSSAYIAYLMSGRNEAFHDKLEEMEKVRDDSPEDIENIKIVSTLTDPKDYFRMMRRMMPRKIKNMLITRAVDQEGAVGEMIREKILTSGNDEFIENTADYMIKSSFDYSRWILENYDRVRSPYARSQLCLVLGFRNCVDCNEFLIDQYEYFLENEDPREYYDQGPLVALYMINGMEDEI